MYTLSEARDQAKPILQGLSDTDLLAIVNEVLAERQQLSAQQSKLLEHASPEQQRLTKGPSVARGRELFDARHKRGGGK